MEDGMAEEKVSEQEERTCPYCREPIHPEATRCKHCQSWLEPKPSPHAGTCPYCKESIQPEAVVCKHCGSSLSEESRAMSPRGGCRGCGGESHRRSARTESRSRMPPGSIGEPPRGVSFSNALPLSSGKTCTRCYAGGIGIMSGVRYCTTTICWGEGEEKVCWEYESQETCNAWDDLRDFVNRARSTWM